MPNRLTSILIVDNNHDLRVALADLFADCGHKVRTAADGFAALAEMKSELPLGYLIVNLPLVQKEGADQHLQSFVASTHTPKSNRTSHSVIAFRTSRQTPATPATGARWT